jgi:Zn finger protein HypA/HybF involved in hydrogenase expression
MENILIDDTPTETVTEAVKKRHCLRCSSEFESTWAGHRICPRCKSTSAWRAGESAHSQPTSRRR